jgi:hypothetical protein
VKDRKFWIGLYILLVLLGLPLALPVSASPWQQGGPWNTPVNLSNTTTKSAFPDLAVDGAGHIHVVWSEYFSDHTGWGDAIFYTMWDGTSWSTPNDILISPSGRSSHLPAIAVDQRGLIHIVWTDTVDVFYSHAWAQDASWRANSWSTPKVLASGGTHWPDIAVDDHGNVHVVWTGNPTEGLELIGENCVSGCPEIYYARSTDGGQTWLPVVNVSTSREHSTYPNLAIGQKGDVHIAWTETTYGEDPLSTMYARSPNGEAWDDPVEIVVGDQKPSRPSLDVDSQGRVHAMWPCSNALCYRWSDEQGNWSEIVSFTTGVQIYRGYLPVALVLDSGDQPYAALSFQPNKDRHADLFLGRWAADTWSPIFQVTDSATLPLLGHIVLSEGNKIHLVWMEEVASESGEDSPANMEVFYTRYETDSPELPVSPLPPMPAPTAMTPTAQPVSTTQLTTSVTPRATPGLATTIATDSTSSTLAPVSGLTTGIGAAILVLGISVSALLVQNRRRKRRKKRTRRRKRKHRHRPYYTSQVEILTEDPHPRVRLKRDLGGRLRLLGYNPPAGPLHAGESCRVTYYWQVLDGFAAPFDAKSGTNPESIETHRTDYMLADRFIGAAGQFSVLHLPTHIQMPPEAWQPGQVIREAYDFRLPADARGKYDWSVGLYAVPKSLGIKVNSERQVPGVEPIALGMVTVQP